MANQTWLDDVRRRMVEQGLPPAYIRRFMDELADHLEDLKSENLTEETMSTEANAASRLGDANQVADAAVTAYRRRSFLGRHPTAAFLVFGVSPVVSLIFAMICSLVAMQLFCQLARICDEDIGSALPYVGSLGLIILPSVLVSVSYCELARRLGIAKKWTVIACVVVACIAALNGFCESISASGERYTHDGIGFHSPMQLVQFLIPLWIGWCYARPERDRHGSLIAFLVFAASPILLLMMLFALEIIGFSILHVIFGKEISLPFGIVIDGWEWKVPTTAGGILFIVISLALTIGPCGLLSVFYWKLAGWFDIRKRWALVSCFLLAFVAILPGYFERDMCRPEQLYLGRVEQLGQFLIPLAVGWWFMRRKRADSPQLVAAAA